MPRPKVLVPALPEKAEATVRGYEARETVCSRAEWLAVSDFVREVVRRLQPQSSSQAWTDLTKITRFVVHRTRAGVEADVAVMFSNDSVESQLAIWRAPTSPTYQCGLSAQSISDEAAYLRRVARRLNPLGGFAVTNSKGRKRTLGEPYSLGELAEIRDTLWAPNGDVMWRPHRTIMALGHGVGASRSEAAAVCGGDVREADGGNAVVRMPHPEGGTVDVPVGAPYSTWLLKLATEGGTDSRLVCDVRWARGGELCRTLPKTLPAFNIGRLRNTWLADRLAAGVAPTDILKYGRYTTFSFLTSFAAFIPGREGDELVHALVGSPRT